MKKLLTALLLLAVVFITGCKEDDHLARVGVCPLVVSTIPADKAVNVPINQVISATFNENMNPATITNASFTVTGTTAIAGTITYSGLIATFRPTTPLLPNTTYTGKLTTAVKDLLGQSLQFDHIWSFTTGVSPTVISTDPVNAATNVLLTKVVNATFSVPMDPLTINATTVTLSQGTTPVVGTVTYAGSTITFTPATALAAGTVYTGTITTGAKNIIGTPLATNFVWKFNTGVSPTVISTDPANNAISIPLNKIVAATFSVAMDPLTITATTFTLKQGANLITGAVSYTGTTASFTPAVALTPNTIYTGTITTGAKNVAGIPLASNYTWTFTTLVALAPTVITTDPANNAKGVALNKVVAATFSVPMDPLTITGTTFTLKQGITSIAGAVSYSGSTTSFTPTLALTANTVYTGTITAGAKNVAGTPLANDYVWSFTTLTAPLQPQFSSIFGAFGGNAGITNQGIYTVINNGSIGTTAASTLITGLHDNTGDSYSETPLNIGNVKGRIYTAAPPPVIFAAGGPYGGNAATMAIAQAGLLAASDFYISISPANKPGGTILDTDELGGRTLAPGIYKSGSSYNITTVDLTLDALGDANAVWIFQVPSALTVGTPTGARTVNLINGALAKNVFWYVGTSAVINYAGGGTMVGTIIANSGVTLSSPGNSTNTTVQTVLNGRAISLVSTVTMVNTIINVPN